ncbi:MAG TPA: helix-turn-helix domain-containing protein [Candidatus Thermoplasmatota archaeon]|nr:helix-turn-helix domain-containing protein [Candidatus Thermoplasmatota archaeon]
MAGPSFDIYHSVKGYVTISNEVQRRILAAVADRDASFQDLVQASGRSKPTVSQQVKELIASDLLEEKSSSTDRRRRFYHLIGQRIGSSDLPVPDLRNAVRDYVQKSSEPSLKLPLFLEALAGTDAAAATCWRQASVVGSAMASQMELGLEGGPWMRLARFFEKSRLAKPLRIDVEGNRLECELDPALKGPAGSLAAGLGGLVDGAWKALGKGGVAHSLEGRRLSLWQK